MTEQEERVTHIIYGYRCKLGKKKGQWKIGCTLQGSTRHYQHTLGQSSCVLFDNYLNARKGEGYSYDDVFEYFQLRVFVCTSREAETWERIYTERYNAVDPHGFCLKPGGYKGALSEETKQKMSKIHKGKKTTEETKRLLSKKARARNKYNCAGLKRLSERMRGKKQGPRPWSKETIQRRKEKSWANEIDKRKNGLGKKLPTLTGTDIAAFIVIKAGRPMSSREVTGQMNKEGRKTSSAWNLLLRACGLNTTTLEKMPNHKKTRLEKIKVGNKTLFCAKPELTSWMIPE